MDRKAFNRHQVAAAIAAAEQADATPSERAEMLSDVATALHRRAEDDAMLLQAIELYERALGLIGHEASVLRARIASRRAAACAMTGGLSVEQLKSLRKELAVARDQLAHAGEMLEAAECDMNLGQIAQELAAANAAPARDAIRHYQQALQHITGDQHPCEFAVIQNNLALLYLNAGGEPGMAQALALQSFEAALAAISANQHPREYGMVQNNLANTLLHAESGHPLENLLRARAAYDEALKVRTRAASPRAFATTLANKAQCLSMLPDDPEQPQAGNPRNCEEAIRLLSIAAEVLESLGEQPMLQVVRAAIEELRRAAA